MKRFKNLLKSSNGHASSSTIRVSQDFLDAPTNPSQAREVPQQEQAPNLPQQEQAPNPSSKNKLQIPCIKEISESATTRTSSESATTRTSSESAATRTSSNSRQQEQAPILPSNSSRTSVHPRLSTGYWRVETIGIYSLSNFYFNL